jgi:hypothetical protein
MPALNTLASNAQTKRTEQPNGVPFLGFPVLVCFFWGLVPKKTNHRKASTKRGTHGEVPLEPSLRSGPLPSVGLG